MRLSIVCAMDRNALIGTDGCLPWHLPADLKRFRRLTAWSPLIMGRKTWQSLPFQPLPQRPNIVVTRTWPGVEGPVTGLGCDIAKSVDHAINVAMEYTEIAGLYEAFVIGGASIFAATLPLVDRIYLTLIKHEFDPGPSPVYFPGGVSGIPQEPKWRVVDEERGKVDDRNPWLHTFWTLDRSGRPSV
jgi:dihydrofolate reductase